MRKHTKRAAVPTRAEGWKFAGRAGAFHVWHAGANDYRVTDGAEGDPLRRVDLFGKAHAWARHFHDAQASA